MEGREERAGPRAAQRQKTEAQRTDPWAAASPGPLSADFLSSGLDEAGVTGEVMNLDDFLKELNEPGPPSTPAPAARISVFQSVGRAPVLRYGATSPTSPPPGPPSPPEEQKPAIPQACVRPQQRARAAPGSGARKRKAASATVVREEPVVKQETRDEQEDEQLSEEEGQGAGREGKDGFTSTVMVNFSADDLRLATIPGQEGDFDPATRRFSEDELKPQPIIRKRRKQFVPDELKNGKYWAKRNINNEAAKRSREARRLKENQIAMRARFLEEENNVLKVEVDELKKENGEMRLRMMALEQRIAEVATSRC